MKHLPLIVRNLSRNRRRTLLTVLSMGVSVFIFAALVSLPAVVNQILRDSASSLRLICHNKAGFTYPLPASYEGTIRAFPHVDAVTGYSVFVGTYRDPRVQIPAAALEPDVLRAMWPEWNVTAESAAALQHDRIACLVSADLMREYRWKPDDRIILHGVSQADDLELGIVGALGGSKAPKGLILFRRDYLDEINGATGKVILFFIKVDRSEAIPQVIRAIDGRFANSSFETETESEVNVGRDQVRSYRLLFRGAEYFAAIVIFVIGLVAANTAAMAVRERRSEMAVMRSIGYTRRAMVALLVAEGAAIGIAGGIAGTGFAWAVLTILPHVTSGQGLFPILKLLPRVAAESFGIAALIGVASAAIPALIATRGDIAAELRAL